MLILLILKKTNNSDKAITDFDNDAEILSIDNGYTSENNYALTENENENLQCTTGVLKLKPIPSQSVNSFKYLFQYELPLSRAYISDKQG